MTARGEIESRRLKDGRYAFSRAQLEAIRLREAERSTEERLGLGRATYAAILADLDAGKPPTEIACERQLFASEVAAVRDDWLSIREVPGPSALEGRMLEMEARCQLLERQLADNPMTGLHSEFTCAGCNSVGNVAVDVTCTACGKDEKVGYWPTPEEPHATDA